MLNTTTSRLHCPRRKNRSKPCGGALSLEARKTSPLPGRSKDKAAPVEVLLGTLHCTRCRAQFPILAGVAILVENVPLYFQQHCKGISQLVPQAQIPRNVLSDYLEAKAALEEEHIEEDLEAERVNALYVMNHYLSVRSPGAGAPWWQPASGDGSPLIDSLIRQNWDQGPLERLAQWMDSAALRSAPRASMIELGCGVGGLYRRVESHLESYLGVDSSFTSIALARHLALGFPYPSPIRIPEDLLDGPVSREVRIAPPPPADGRADFVVGELENLPVQEGTADLCVAMNAIDMLDEPALLPATQTRLLKPDGVAVQSCPYIWHAQVARKLRKTVPKTVRTSAAAVEWLYEKAGLRIEERIQQVPWLFFKHVRQLEVYSVHLFVARRV